MEKRKKRLKSIILSVVFLLILIAVTYYALFNRFEFGDIAEIISESDKTYLIFGFAMIFIYLLCYGQFTSACVRMHGYKANLWQRIVYASADFYFSAITPSATGGQPFVTYYMAKNGIPYSVGMFSTLLQAIIYKIVLLFLSVVSLVLYFGTWVNAGWLFILLWCLGLVLTSSVLVLVTVTMYKRNATFAFVRFLIRAAAKLHIVKDAERLSAKFGEALDDYQVAAKLLKGRKLLLLKLFLITLLQRVAYFSVAFIIYRSFGNTEFGFFYFLAVQVFIAVAVDALPLPGGMGANEIAIIMMYRDTFGSEKAAGAMLLIRFVNFYFGLMITASITFVNHLYNTFFRKRNAE